MQNPRVWVSPETLKGFSPADKRETILKPLKKPVFLAVYIHNT